MKRFFSIVFTTIIFSLSFLCVPHAKAADFKAKLYSVYGNYMLFQQNEEAVIAGTGTGGDIITAELYDSQNNLVTYGKSAVKSNGTFEVSFEAPSGSYNEYTVILKENSAEFAKLENVVFGELWLASGQSNMQYPLAQSRTGREMFANLEKLSKWLRVLLVPAYPEYNGSNELIPSEPQKEIPGAEWITGENSTIYGTSAVAYFFASELMNELDMPVGILNASLGGSSIRSWISREAIDNNAKVRDILASRDEYIEKSAWNEAKQNIYSDMTTNYNLRIVALKNFRPSGMIWYQGETDIMTGLSDEEYAAEFDLLQNSYTDLFNYKKGLFPIVYTQIASYHYSDNSHNLFNRNIEFAQMQKQQPESRAVISIYDVPITFIPEAGLIHPERKEEIGERMAFSALGLVYNKYDSYTAPIIKEFVLTDGAVIATFDNVGNGLKAKGDTLYGFAVCGDDGIYVEAKAEIIGKDIIKIWNECISDPKSASYAYSIANSRSNLYATLNGEFTLPVSSFVTDMSVGTHYWIDKQWADCDDELIWHTVDDEFSKYYSSWQSVNVEISVDSKSSYVGSNGLRIKGNGSFLASPILTYKNGVENISFDDIDTDYSDYGTISFNVRNNGTKEVVFSGLKLYKNALIQYSPAIFGTKDCETVIPADGEWHCIILDLNRLYLFGNECGLSYPNDKLNYIKNIEFCFSASDADLSFDNICFTPSNEPIGIRYDVDINSADNLIEFVSAVAVKLIGAFMALFE